MSTLNRLSIMDPAHVLDRLATFYSKINNYRWLDRFTDVTIRCKDDWNYRCHRMALSAASVYFDRLFSANFREGRSNQDVYLRNIDGEIFGKILVYVYSGKIVPIDDDNVYLLLYTSDFLVISDIEKHCTHYLIEKNIPMKHALSIYLLASRLDKKTIKCVTGRFILQHLNHFCHVSEFLRIPLCDLSPILKHFYASTKSKEHALLNVIFKWASNLTNMNGGDMRSTFMELTQEVWFEFLRPMDITRYFSEKSVFRYNRTCDRDMPACPEDFNFMVEEKEPSLHAFFHFRRGAEDKFCVYSLRQMDEEAKWFLSSSSDEAVEEMQVIEANGLLYSLKWSGNRWTFNSSTEVDLRTNLISLALPVPLNTIPDFIIGPYDDSDCTYSQLSMCSLRNDVYLFGLDVASIPLQYYNTALGIWSVIENVANCEWKPVRMASDDNRIYMIMYPKENNFHSFVFRAYDPRDGRLEILNFPEIITSNDTSVACCCHQNGIYVSRFCDILCTKKTTNFELATYDPCADKWNVLNMGARNLWYDILDHRLISDRRTMWIYGCSFERGNIHVLPYDSYEQKWDTDDDGARNLEGEGSFIRVAAL